MSTHSLHTSIAVEIIDILARPRPGCPEAAQDDIQISFSQLICFQLSHLGIKTV
jgi:hypothetical protein